MKKTLSSTLLFLCFFGALQSQIVVGTPAGVSGAMFRNNLAKAYQSVIDLGFQRAELIAQLEKGRQEFWAQYPDIKADSEIAEHYYYWLTQRDFYTMGIALSNYIENAVDSRRWENNTLDMRGTADLLNSFVGGRQEDLIEPYAKKTYKAWETAIINYWRDNGTGIFDAAALLQANESQSHLYDAHFLRVLQAEYLFHSPNSPLKSSDPLQFIGAVFLLSDMPKAMEMDTYLQTLNRRLQTGELQQGMEDWKQHYGENRSWTDQLRKEAGRQYPMYTLEWYLIKNSNPTTYALFQIQRRFLLGWETAELILTNRVKRYGQDKVDAAMQTTWTNRDNHSYRCIGHPYLNRSDRRLSKIGVDWYSIKSNEDCQCAELGGNQVLWQDLYDWVAAQPLEPLRKDFIKRYQLSVAQYAQLSSVLSADLLLRAEYLQHQYGDILFMADQIGVLDDEALAKVSDVDRPSYASSTLRILDGLAEVAPHPETHLVILHWKKQWSTQSYEETKAQTLMEALQPAVESILQLYAKFGKEKVLNAFKAPNQPAPDPFTNIFTMKNRWSSYLLDQLHSKLAAGDTQTTTAAPAPATASPELTAEAIFLSKNKLKANIQTTDSGLQYEVLKSASGPSPTADQTVIVHYRGSLLDGTVVQDTYGTNTPGEFQLKLLFSGLVEGIQLMQVGAKYRFYVPSALAYGSRTVGNIPADSLLIYEVELLGIQ